MDVICYGAGRREAPENTVEAITHCQKVNTEWKIEIDVQMTKDGELVLFHDENTKRITGEIGKIENITYDEIQQLNAGHYFEVDGGYPFCENPLSIPRLEDVFAIFPKAHFLLDIHSSNPLVVQKMITLIDQYENAGKMVIVSKYDRITELLKNKRPEWIYGAGTKEAKNLIYSSFVMMDKYFPLSSDILMIPETYGKTKVLTNRVIGHVKRRNKKIWVWVLEGNEVKTIDNKVQYNQMKELGVDGVITAFPEKLNQEIS